MNLVSMIFLRWSITFYTWQGMKGSIMSVIRKVQRSSGWWHPKSPSTIRKLFWWSAWRPQPSVVTFADRSRNSPSWRTSAWWESRHWSNDFEIEQIRDDDPSYFSYSGSARLSAIQNCVRGPTGENSCRTYSARKRRPRNLFAAISCFWLRDSVVRN